MSATIIAPNAVQFNIVDYLAGYPSVGVNVGLGPWVTIPPNWAQIVAGGTDVPGVTRTQGVNDDGSLTVPDAAVRNAEQPSTQAALATKFGLPAVSQFNTAAGIVVGGSAQVIK